MVSSLVWKTERRHPQGRRTEFLPDLALGAVIRLPASWVIRLSFSPPVGYCSARLRHLYVRKPQHQPPRNGISHQLPPSTPWNKTSCSWTRESPRCLGSPCERACRKWTFRLNIGLNTSPSDSFVSYLNSHLGYSAGEFQALQLIVLAVFGAVD